MLKTLFMAEVKSLARFAARLLASAFLLAVSPHLRAQDAPAGTAAVPASEAGATLVGVAIDEVGIGPADLARSRELILATFDAMPKGTEMMVASFTGEQRIVLAATSDRDLIVSTIETFKAGASGVALPDGLFDMVDYLATRSARNRALLLISAGRVRDGDLQFEDPLNAATLKGIPIFALGVGQGDGKLLRRIAKITGGEYVRLEVADAPMLARSLQGASSSGISASATPSADAVPSPEASNRGSAGLLGAAAIFFSLGGLLMLGIVVLLIRRMSSSKPAASPVPVAPPPPRPARAIPQADLRLETGVTSAAALSDSSPQISQTLTDADPIIEKTMVVNANPTLRALSGPGAGKNFPLMSGGRTTIGRSRSNDIVVPEDAASAHHCRIDREGDSYVIHNQRSTNGTWVNGAKVERAVLQHGDKVKIGETIFMVGLFGDRG